MSKGIIVRTPGGGMAGKIIVTEGVINNADGTASAVDSGTVISYNEESNAMVGDLVDLSVDNTNTGKGIKVLVAGKVLTGVIPDPLDVGPNDVITVNAGTFEGTITVNGGILTIIGGTTISGFISAPVAGSVILIDQKCVIDGTMMVKTASRVSVRDSTFTGKLSTNGTTFTAIVGCTIGGKLEVLNAKDCFSSANAVTGKDDSTGCRH